MALKCPKCQSEQAVAVLEVATPAGAWKKAYPCLTCGYAHFDFHSNVRIKERYMGLFGGGRHRGGRGDDHDEDINWHECPEPGCQGSVGFRDITNNFGSWVGQDVTPCNKCGYNGQR